MCAHVGAGGAGTHRGGGTAPPAGGAAGAGGQPGAQAQRGQGTSISNRHLYFATTTLQGGDCNAPVGPALDDLHANGTTMRQSVWQDTHVPVA